MEKEVTAEGGSATEVKLEKVSWENGSNIFQVLFFSNRLMISTLKGEM